MTGRDVGDNPLVGRTPRRPRRDEDEAVGETAETASAETETVDQDQDLETVTKLLGFLRGTDES
ncbi:MAG: hypothetical protein JXA83_06220 [Acidimicrobiales bacterium]|nr:hypothetical protein [Acidimicrobiales bacterium]